MKHHQFARGWSECNRQPVASDAVECVAILFSHGLTIAFVLTVVSFCL